MEVHVYIVDAFSASRFGGTAIGVVPTRTGINPSDYGLIANEMRTSVTCFVEQLKEDIFDIRFFTPAREIGESAQASIACFNILTGLGYIKPVEKGVKVVFQLSAGGHKKVYINYENWVAKDVEIELARPSIIKDDVDVGELLENINVKEEDIEIMGKKAEVSIVECFEKSIILPLKSKEALDAIKAEDVKFKDNLKNMGADNLHAVYYPDEYSSFAYARNFSLDSVFEEGASSAFANGAFLYYLKKKNLRKELTLSVKQGEKIMRPSVVGARYLEDNSGPIMLVKGSAQISLDGILKI